MLDAIATRYHVLPSEVVSRADTLDYFVMDVSMSYHRLQQERADAKAHGRAPPPQDLPLNKLQEMMERVRR
jgi:hypothetical protein